MDNARIREAVKAYMAESPSGRDSPKARYKYGDMEDWDLAGVYDLSYLFEGKAQFNVGIGRWNVAGVRTMAFMFHGCAAFRGAGLGAWQTGAVEDMRFMFYGCGAFRGWDLCAGLGGWDTCAVEPGKEHRLEGQAWWVQANANRSVPPPHILK